MLRIAAIEFLNAAPLMWGLESDARFRLEHTLPSACADALRDATADLGVIPAIELGRVPDLVGVGGIGVASRDAAGAEAEVRSILLISRVPMREVRRVALDRASRTSAALAQILLRRYWGAEFECRPMGDREWRNRLQRECDAVLMIGDPALRARVRDEAAGFEVHDLARVWRDWTGLPFVFALWGVRRPAWEENASWLGERLTLALEQGLAHRESLVTLWARHLDLPEDDIRRYLEKNVAYRLKLSHVHGLRRFFALAAEQGLLPSAALPPLAEPAPA